MQEKEVRKMQHEFAAMNLRKEQTVHMGKLEVYKRKKFFGGVWNEFIYFKFFERTKEAE